MKIVQIYEKGDNVKHLVKNINGVVCEDQENYKSKVVVRFGDVKRICKPETLTYLMS